MTPIRRISRSSGFTARRSALIALALGLGLPGICIALFVVYGLAASPLVGPSAWDPAHDFIGGAAHSVTSMPGLIAVAALLLLAIALPATACFGRWCLTQTAARPADWRLPPMLRRPLLHLVGALARALMLPAGIATNPGVTGIANLTGPYSPQRTSASTPAGLSGASPLLE